MHYLVKNCGFSYKELHELPIYEFEAHVNIMIRDKKAEAEAKQKEMNKINS